MKKLTCIVWIAFLAISVCAQTEDLSINQRWATYSTSNNNFGKWAKIAECNITYAWQDFGGVFDFFANGSGNSIIYYGRIIARFKNQNSSAQPINNWKLILQNSNLGKDNLKAVRNGTKVEVYIRIPSPYTVVYFRKILNGGSHLTLFSNQSFHQNLPSGDLTIDCIDGSQDIDTKVLSLRKEKNTSRLLFAAQQNDPGEIRHIENNNAAELWIDPSDDFDTGATNDYFIVGEPDTNTRRFWVRGDGYAYIDNNLGVGKVPSDEVRMDVAGIIRATEIKVEADWADFVFKNDYQLRELSQVESYIAEHGHLPEIPSEAEVQEHGISLGEMDAKLLMKIEELTLYSIEQEKKIKELKEDRGRMTEEVSGYKSQVVGLEERLAKMEALLEEVLKK